MVKQRQLPSPDAARLIRVLAGVSQRELAQELGVDRVTVARWELGMRVPRGELRAKYARLLRELQEAISER
jgi:transcriptional regulator with XRE-family HTH domain